MSHTFGFLVSYIQNNPDITLEEVLNDEDFLDVLKLKDEVLLNFLVKHFDKILGYVIEEPPIQSDYKRGYKFPFLAAEILSIDSPIILNQMFSSLQSNQINLSDSFKSAPLFIFLVSELSKLSTHSSDTAYTIAGYLGRIVLNAIRQSKDQVINCMNNPEYFEFITQSMIRNINFDEVSQIFFELLRINIKNTELSEQSQESNNNINLKINLINKLFESVHILQKENSDNKIDKIKNIILILIKFLKFMFEFKENKILFQTITSKTNLEIIENIFLEKSENKMSDDNKEINEEDNQIITSLLMFYFNLIQVSLIPPMKNEVITSNLFDEEVALEVNLHGNDFSKVDKVDIIEEEKEKEKEKGDSENLIEKVDKKDNFTSNNIPNMSSYLDEEAKTSLIEYFNRLFPQIFEMASKLKSFSGKNKIETMQNGTVLKPISQGYLIFTDILILLISIKSEKILNTLKQADSLFNLMIDDFILYPHNSFLSIKNLKIFEILLFDPFYQELKLLLLKRNIFSNFSKFVDFNNFINLENKTLSYKNVNSINYSFIVRLLNYFYVSMKANLEISEIASIISNEELSVFENYLSVYLEITSKDLLSDKIQSIEDLKNAGDEDIKVNLEKNFYDSEAFLFTTKKIIENSKKINQKLKELDS